MLYLLFGVAMAALFTLVRSCLYDVVHSQYTELLTLLCFSGHARQHLSGWCADGLTSLKQDPTAVFLGLGLFFRSRVRQIGTLWLFCGFAISSQFIKKAPSPFHGLLLSGQTVSAIILKGIPWYIIRNPFIAGKPDLEDPSRKLGRGCPVPLASWLLSLWVGKSHGICFALLPSFLLLQGGTIEMLLTGLLSGRREASLVFPNPQVGQILHTCEFSGSWHIYVSAGQLGTIHPPAQFSLDSPLYLLFWRGIAKRNSLRKSGGCWEQERKWNETPHHFSQAEADIRIEFSRYIFFFSKLRLGCISLESGCIWIFFKLLLSPI